MLRSRIKSWVAGVAFSCCLATVAFSWDHGTGTAIPANFVSISRLGGMGFLTGIDIASSGAPVLYRTDTGGAYICNSTPCNSSSTFYQLLTQDSLPPNQVGYYPYPGTFTGAISGTTLTAGSVTSPVALGTGQAITGAGVTASTSIGSLGTGVGGAGTYTVNNSQTVGSETLTATGSHNALTNTAGVQGVWEIRACPLTPTTAYMASGNGNLFKTTNLSQSLDTNGQTSTRWSQLTGFTQATMNANDGAGYRLIGPKMAVDPSDCNVVVLGTQNGSGNGLFYSLNGGTSFSSPTNIPATTGNWAYTIVFDSSGGTTTCGGVTTTKNVLIMPNNATTHAWYSTTGICGTFSITSGGPTSVVQSMVSDGAGNIWAVDGFSYTENTIWNFNAGTWTAAFAQATGASIQTISVNPGGTGPKLVAAASGGSIYLCNASCTSSGNWIGPATNGGVVASGIQPTYLNGDPNLSISQVEFDPNQTNVLFLGHGFGGAYINPPTTNVAVNWSMMGAGIEQVISNTVAVANGCMIGGVQDLAVLTNCIPNSYLSALPLIDQSVSLGAGAGMDVVGTNVYAPIGLDAGGAADYSGVSTDNGQHFDIFNTVKITTTASNLCSSSSGGGHTCGWGTCNFVGATVSSTAGLTTWANGSGSIITPFAGSSTNFSTAFSLLFITYRLPVTVVDSTHLCFQDPTGGGLSWQDAWATNGVTEYFYQDSEPLTTNSGAFDILGVAGSGGKCQLIMMSGAQLVKGQRVVVSGIGGNTECNGTWVSDSVSGATVVLDGSTYNSGHTYTGGGALLGAVYSGGAIAADTSGSYIMRVPSEDSQPLCSADGGHTWTEIVEPDAPINQLITNATWSSAAGGTITYTTAAATHMLSPNSFQVHGASPSGYNLNSGNSAAITVSGTSVVITGTGANPGSYVSGGVMMPTTGWGSAYYFWERRAVAADRVNAGTFYLYNWLSGFYKSVNCATGAAITASYTANNLTGSPGTDYGGSPWYNWMMKSVPGEAGHLFMLGGGAVSTGLWRYCNGGGSSGSPEVPTQITGFFSTYAVGYGAAAPGKSYPSIYVVGWYSSDNNTNDAQFGIWRSVDDSSNGSTTCTSGSWQAIPNTTYPNGWAFAQAWDISGDTSAYGYWYAGVNSGFAWGYQN